MPVTRISLKDAGVYFDPRGPLAQELKAAATKGLFSAALRAKRDIVARVIPNLPGSKPIDKGIYRAGWQAERIPGGAVLYNPVPHASMIEYGVPAGNVVASTKAQQALADWARRKLGGLTAAQAWTVAGGILAAMKKRGIFARGRGLRVLETYVRASLPVVLKEEVERELAKVTR